jgi:hypothetical protein
MHGATIKIKKQCDTIGCILPFFFFFATLGDDYVIDKFLKQYSKFSAVPDVSDIGILLLSVLVIDISFSGF